MVLGVACAVQRTVCLSRLPRVLKWNRRFRSVNRCIHAHRNFRDTVKSYGVQSQFAVFDVRSTGAARRSPRFAAVMTQSALEDEHAVASPLRRCLAHAMSLATRAFPASSAFAAPAHRRGVVARRRLSNAGRPPFPRSGATAAPRGVDGCPHTSTSRVHLPLGGLRRRLRRVRPGRRRRRPRP